MTLQARMKHIAGDDRGSVILYALSTCGWCRKTKELLDELQVAYDYVYVDLLIGPDKEEALQKIKVWNPAASFPTLVINNDRSIVGFKEDQIREALGSDAR